MEIEVVPATIGHWEVLKALFATSSGVSECWCMWPLHPPRTFHPECNRNMEELRAILLSGESPGLLALTSERAVGWCALGPRQRYPQYESSNDGSVVWAIPCLYIAPEADRRKVARALIEAATTVAKTNAATAIEGPPPWWLPGDAAAIVQATSTFLENGFLQIGPGARMPELRRTLA